MKKTFTMNPKKLTAIGIFVLSCLFQNIFSQTTYSFFVCGATGSVGPTQTQANATYSSTNLNGSVTVTGGIQQFTVPSTGGYRIEARGGKGYGTFGGRGAVMAGDFTLTAGQVLKILVGQQANTPNTTYNNQYGGGGGSFVTFTNNTPLVVAGGGGGSWATSLTGLSDATVSTSGRAGANGPTNGTGGTAGGGGGSGGSADGGGGLTGNGSGTSGGFAFTNGGSGGSLRGEGGFGGGGGTSSWNNRRSGGGGGYSGGGGAGSTTSGFPEGGGGGSFNSGANQVNVSGSNTGNGMVIITELCNVRISASTTNSLAPEICSGSSVTLTTLAVSNYSWSNGNTTSSNIVVNPTVTTTYSIVGTGSANCVGSSAITVSVVPGVPVLTVNTTTNNLCLGQTVTLTASGSNNISWSGGITNGTGFTPSVSGNYVVTALNACGTSTAQTSLTVAPLSVSAIASNSVICAGQITTLTAASSVNAYTWTPTNASGASVLVSPNVPTIYTVTASDGTCSGSTTVSINALPIPTITSVASSTFFCEGNSATLTASGALSYTWEPGTITATSIAVTPNTPIQYTVTGTGSNNCVASGYQIVIVNPSPTLNVTTANAIICSGGSATINVNGATTYTWSDNSNANSLIVSPTQNTVYSVTGEFTSNNCTSTQTIAISVFNPSLSISGNTAVCSGKSTTLLASGGTNYVWNNGIPGASNIVSPTTNTIYSVSALTNSGSINCPSSGSVQVIVNPAPNVMAATSKTTICKSESAILTASGAQTYSWSTGATTTSITATSSLVTTIVYSVTGTNSLGCQSTGTLALKVEGCVGLDEKTNLFNAVLVYPNPNTGAFKIVFDGDLKVALFNQLGQLIIEGKVDEFNQHTFEINHLAAGVYMLSGTDGTSSFTKKIIVE